MARAPPPSSFLIPPPSPPPSPPPPPLPAPCFLTRGGGPHLVLLARVTIAFRIIHELRSELLTNYFSIPPVAARGCLPGRPGGQLGHLEWPRVHGRRPPTSTRSELSQYRWPPGSPLHHAYSRYRWPPGSPLHHVCSRSISSPGGGCSERDRPPLVPGFLGSPVVVGDAVRAGAALIAMLIHAIGQLRHGACQSPFR